MHITHLLFTNDNLVFCKDSRDQLTNLSLLLWFEAISGLNINFKEIENVEELAQELRCKLDSLLTSYLRLRLDANITKLVVWKRDLGSNLQFGKCNTCSMEGGCTNKKAHFQIRLFIPCPFSTCQEV